MFQTHTFLAPGLVSAISSKSPQVFLLKAGSDTSSFQKMGVITIRVLRMIMASGFVAVFQIDFQQILWFQPHLHPHCPKQRLPLSPKLFGNSIAFFTSCLTFSLFLSKSFTTCLPAFQFQKCCFCPFFLLADSCRLMALKDKIALFLFHQGLAGSERRHLCPIDQFLALEICLLFLYSWCKYRLHYSLLNIYGG